MLACCYHQKLLPTTGRETVKHISVISGMLDLLDRSSAPGTGAVIESARTVHGHDGGNWQVCSGLAVKLQEPLNPNS